MTRQRQASLVEAKKLAERIHAMPEANLPAYQGQLPAETTLLDLRKAAAELVASLQRGDSTADALRRVDKLEGAFRIAQLFSVVSDSELAKYLDTLDKIVELIKSGK